VLFIMFGLCTEIVFTGIWSWWEDFSGGHVTLYYLPAWIAFAAIVVPVWRRIHALAPQIARVASAKG
jgi:hypothetical protein